MSDIDSVESGMTGGENAERTGSSSGASTPGDKEGEKIGSKRVTRSKGQGEYFQSKILCYKSKVFK